MADTIDSHKFSVVINGKQHPILTNAQPIALHIAHLLHMVAAGFCGKLLHSLQNHATEGVGDDT